jgi:hypothetical protein
VLAPAVELCRARFVDIANELAVKNMSAGDAKRTFRNELLLACALVATGLVIAGLSLREISAGKPQQMAQTTQPLQTSPPPTEKQAPAEPATTGTRPTTPAPEPARPDADAQKSGAQPALPPAPAEKTAPPIKERQ